MAPAPQRAAGQEERQAGGVGVTASAGGLAGGRGLHQRAKRRFAGGLGDRVAVRIADARGYARQAGEAVLERLQGLQVDEIGEG